MVMIFKNDFYNINDVCYEVIYRVFEKLTCSELWTSFLFYFFLFENSRVDDGPWNKHSM